MTDDDLQTLGKDIGGKWAQLAVQLGIMRFDIDEIDCVFESLSEKGYQILVLWKSNDRVAADYKKLYYALDNDLIQRRDLAEKYCFE